MIRDRGWLDPLTATIDWRDGSFPSRITGRLENNRPDATLTYQVFHTYGDNGFFLPLVCGSDDNITVCRTSEPIQIDNVAPSLQMSSLDRDIFEGDTLTLPTATFTDPGTADTHAATIDWGDGRVEPGIVTRTGPTTATVTATHAYRGEPGIYPLRLTVEDDDGGAATRGFDVRVAPGHFRFCIYAFGASDGVTILKDATVDCNVGARGRIRVDRQAEVNGGLFSLAADILIGTGAHIRGNVMATTDIRLRPRSEVFGPVHAGEDVIVLALARIDGDVIAGQRVRVSPRAEVTGRTITGASPPSVPPVGSGRFTPNAGGADVTVPSGDTLLLSPGSYGNLTIGNGASLDLSAGVYAFERLVAGAGASIRMDLSRGTIVIDVVDDAIFGQAANMSFTGADADAHSILWRVGDRIDLGERGIYLGTFLATNGQILLREGVRLRGALYGRDVWIGARAEVMGDPARLLWLSLISP